MRLLLAAVVAVVNTPVQAQPAPAQGLPDTVPLRAAIRGDRVAIDRPGMASLATPGFRYVGGQRFVLSSVADAEQHFSVDAAPNGTVRRLFWIQLEEFLPELRHRTYNYSRDSVMNHGGLPWRVNVRPWFPVAPPGSDGAAQIAFLRSQGLAMPDTAQRVRMVYLPESEPWREVMVIYIEAAGVGNPATAEGVIRRAFAGLRVSRSR